MKEKIDTTIIKTASKKELKDAEVVFEGALAFAEKYGYERMNGLLANILLSVLDILNARRLKVVVPGVGFVKITYDTTQGLPTEEK